MKGTRLGPYEILEQLGAGGMGEVWLAQDTRLGRKVAVKVLPEQFASDPERLARFEQEARAAAALNHPHIAAVFDVGEETSQSGGSTHYMVQEYLQGESLRDLLDRGTPELKRSLALGIEIAEALKAAHRAGIVHRDLKPENVFVTGDGHAKVLDFGLAKLTEMATGPLDSQSMSPTVLGTQAGAIMGTAGYMAPEQVQGEQIDARADVFAFGCVFWEMLTGQRAFAGKSVPHTLHKILDEPPEGHGTETGSALPLRLRWLLDRTLAKSPEERTQSAADVLAELRVVASEVDSGKAIAESQPGGETLADTSPPAAAGIPVKLAAPAAVLILALGAAAAWWLAPDPPAAANPPVRFAIELGEEARAFDNLNQRVMGISPDGQKIAFVATDRLWLRNLADLETVIVRGAEDPRAPSFSPDSQQLAFWADDQIKRVTVGAATPVVVGPSPGRPQGVNWANDGYIYVGSTDGEAIFRLPETGGQPELVIQVRTEDAAEYAYGPRLLPGGEWLLYTLHVDRDWATAQIVAQSLVSGERRVLVDGGHDARYVSTGHLLYVTGGVLLAVRFDLDSLEVSGGPVPLLENLRTAGGGSSGAAFYSVADNGTLASISGASSGDRILGWIDRNGGFSALPIEPGRFAAGMDLSPDGERLAVRVDEETGDSIWVYEVDRPGGQRLTTAVDNADPVWSPDGEWVYFASNRDGDRENIWRRRADLSGPEERVLQTDGNLSPGSISRDGQWIYYHQNVDDDRDLYRSNLREPGEPELLVGTAAQEFSPRISPDGRLLLFGSSELGASELFVLEIESGRRWRITDATTGTSWLGDWSPTTPEILLANRTGVYSVSYALDPEFSPELPRLDRLFPSGALDTSMEMTPDAERVLSRFTDFGDGESAQRVDLVLNWFTELLERAPVER